MKYLIKNINDINDNILKKFYSKIPKYKKETIKKYTSNKKRKQSLVGEYLLNNLLKQELNINYEDILFRTNKNGKPETDIIKFNIAHSNDYVITAISNNNIGIDIEQIRKTNLNTLKYFATTNEINYILKSKQNIEKRLFEIYTLKEAYIKMLGKELKNINEIEFNISKNNITCSNKNIKSKIIYDIDNYIIAICEKKTD